MLAKLLCQTGSQLKVLKPRVPRTMLEPTFAFLEVLSAVNLGLVASVVLGKFQIKKADVC